MQWEVSRLFTWPGITNDIKQFISSCDRCLKFNKRGPWRVPMHNPPVFHMPFECISSDIVGQFRPGTGMKCHILNPFAEPRAGLIALLTTKQIAVCLIELFARQGLPREILSDQVK